jgi:aminopeptidase YwaD
VRIAEDTARRRAEARGGGGSRAALLATFLAVALAGSACTASAFERTGPRARIDPAPPRVVKVPVVESTSSAAVLTTSTPKVPTIVSAVSSETTSPVVFSAERAMVHVRHLADDIGVRPAGSRQEREAADYVVAQLKLLGYEPRIEEFTLPNKRLSRNVIARKPGSSARVVVLGAHLDSKPPAPGANDAATGVGALLAMASALSSVPTTATIEFAFFGAEEIIGADVTQHHHGSRHRVATLSTADKQSIAGMISLDVIARGNELYARSMKRGPQTLVNDLLAFSHDRLPMTFKLDPAKTGMSDHEPYELAGIPAVWVESLPDPDYHKPTDVGSHIDVRRLQSVGQLVLDYVVSRTAEDLARLRR